MNQSRTLRAVVALALTLAVAACEAKRDPSLYPPAQDAADVGAEVTKDSANGVDTSPAKDVAGADVVTKDVAAKDVAAKDITAKDVTAEDVTAEDVAVSDVAAEDVAAEDVAAEDVATADITAADVTTEDGAGEDGTADVAISQDIAAADASPLDVPAPQDADADSQNADAAQIADAATSSDGGGCKWASQNCPGGAAPVWKLEDKHPKSAGFKSVYGLDKFVGKVTVLALLAGW